MVSTLINQRNFYLDEKLKINSTLKWEYSYRSYYTDKPFDGTYVRFDCRGYEWILNGPETITCTSHGNYSAAPPTCQKRPDRETDSSSSSKFMSDVYLYIPTYLPTTYYQRLDTIKMCHSTYFPNVCVSVIFRADHEWSREMSSA
jgi:hypothetical protein